jgi:hypothetical protein
MAAKVSPHLVLQRRLDLKTNSRKKVPNAHQIFEVLNQPAPEVYL